MKVKSIIIGLLFSLIVFACVPYYVNKSSLDDKKCRSNKNSFLNACYFLVYQNSSNSSSNNITTANYDTNTYSSSSSLTTAFLICLIGAPSCSDGSSGSSSGDSDSGGSSSK
ncbi:MAG: hypothetical protein KDK90_15910 [Leptospiraceae bacterium]|nr:hypothetical protein [Leptospiraceae bacterium]